MEWNFTFFLIRKVFESIGITIKATKREQVNATAAAKANGVKKLPTMPPVNPIGIKTPTVVAVEVIIALPTSATDCDIVATLRLSPFAKCLNIFSITTILSSTILPIATVSPERDIILREIPNAPINIIVKIMDKGMDINAISVVLTERRNKRIIRTVSAAPNKPSRIIPFIELTTSVEES